MPGERIIQVDMSITRPDVLGVGFDNLTLEEAVSAGMKLAAAGTGEYAVTPNPEIVWMCRKNEKLRAAVNSASLVLADGIGVIYGARILGRPLKERVPGIDYALALMGEMAPKGMSVFLLGAKPGVSEKAAEKLAETFPGLSVAGTHDGYFSDEAPVAAAINKAAPDLLLVCLGAPKQELFMAENAGKLNAKLMIGLGGALDVFAGNAERAPERWRRAGFEWLYRLLKQPKRIVRMAKLPLFLLRAVMVRVFGK